MIKEAIVLAGGLGTRLKGVIDDIPKPMAPIGQVPFLEYLLSYLNQSGITHAILAVGYKHEVISDYFGKQYKNISLSYAIEHEPMGTGGGIANALKFALNDELFLLNGDTFFEVDLNKLAHFHESKHSDLSLSLKHLKDFDRYGSVEINQNKISSFKEKQIIKDGYINGGVYVISKKLFKQEHLGEKFSFEQDVMEKAVETFSLFGMESKGYFIDIGIPTDYESAQKELPTKIELG